MYVNTNGLYSDEIDVYRVHYWEVLSIVIRASALQTNTNIQLTKHKVWIHAKSTEILKGLFYLLPSITHMTFQIRLHFTDNMDDNGII